MKLVFGTGFQPVCRFLTEDNRKPKQVVEVMKKKSRRSSWDLDTITSRQDAILAFGRGDVLSKKERRKILFRYFPGQARVSLYRSCVIAVKYGLGMIEGVGKGLTKIVIAWLRTSNEVWRRIVRVARTIDWHALSYSKFCVMLRRRLRSLCHTPEWAW